MLTPVLLPWLPSLPFCPFPIVSLAPSSLLSFRRFSLTTPLYLTGSTSLSLSLSLSPPLLPAILSFHSQRNIPNPQRPGTPFSGGIITILASVILPKLQPKPSALPSSSSTSSMPVPSSSSSSSSSSNNITAAAASTDSSVRHLGVTPLFGALLIVFWLAVLVGTIVAANATPYAGAEFLHWFQVNDGGRMRVVERGREEGGGGGEGE